MDLGRGQRAVAFPPQGFDPLPTQRVPPPLCTILKHTFLVTDPKNVLRAPSAPGLIDFEGGARAEDMRFFWSKNSKKCLKLFFGMFFF